MSGLVTALGVIALPEMVSLYVVHHYGPAFGIIVLLALIIWLVATLMTAFNPGSAPIQPEIFGGQTISYRQRTGLPELFYATFVIGPATLWALIALFIGRTVYRRAEGLS